METPAPSTPTAVAYHDRSTGLLVFGIFEIILGGFAALMIPLVILGQAMAAKQHEASLDTSLQGSTFLTFALLAVGLIWLGIGSIQARRWARALLLCLGAVGLCIGMFSLVSVIISLGSMEAIMRQSGQELPPAALLIGKIVAVGMVLVMYVIIPGALVLFYRSRHVKLTCEHRDPVERWTDRCPLPVLAWCLVQAYGAVSMLLMWKFSSAVPLFGFVVTGGIARVLWVGFAGFTLWSAWGLYRLNARVRLIYLVVSVLAGISSLITFSRVNLFDYYRTIGLPEWQLKQIALSPLAQGHNFLWFFAASMVIFVGYQFFLQRYFVQPRAL